MRLLRSGQQRGRTTAPGLDGRSAFSSGDLHDPAWMGFGVLRACHEYRVAVGGRAPPPARANMEILTFVLDGTLRDAHGDLHAPGVAWAGAGAGTELDGCLAAGDRTLHVLQAWIQPAHVNLPPVAARIAGTTTGDGWQLVAAPDGAGGALPVRQQAWAWRGRVADGAALVFEMRVDRRYWMQVVGGALQCGAERLQAGDALACYGEAGALCVQAGSAAGGDVLLFDLPG
ncbi:MAG TPA: hypothetical protein VLK29_09925 [Luteimonas sp.]|nr:hypothetical protein [Luteimonas sp.]